MRLVRGRVARFGRLRVCGGAFVLAAAVGAGPANAASSDPFPAASRPAQRLQAVAALSGGASHLACLTPIVQSLKQDPSQGSTVARRALMALQAGAPLPGEVRVSGRDGTVIRFTIDRNSLDRVEGADGDAVPDAVEVVLAAAADARQTLVERLELPSPGPVEFMLARIGAGQEGLVLPSPSRDGRVLIAIESGARMSAASLRRAVFHQYAHAVASAAGIPPAWGEALATWVNLRSGDADDRAYTAVAHRLDRSAAGLATDDLELAAGNAAWLSFLEESYGSYIVRLAVEEMSRAGAPMEAMDRALRRGAGLGLTTAYRDFDVWNLFRGERDDGKHFSFAARLTSPPFASRADGLPALSVQSDPAVAGLGAAHVLIRPGRVDGGMTLRFEGDRSARWEADALVTRSGRLPHRIPLAVDGEGKGQVSLPLEAVEEVVLLVRNVDPADRTGRLYSWSVFRESGYPAEVSWIAATEAPGREGVVVSWETRTERAVVGFNVYRASREGAEPSRVNPVWIPAIGDTSEPASYQFVDRDADLDHPAFYQVEAITPEGLETRTAPVRFDPRPRSR